jgi:hypothetical protein
MAKKKPEEPKKQEAAAKRKDDSVKKKEETPARKAEPAKPARAERTSWLDDESEAPLIEKYARQLDSFIQTMADGKVEAAEIDAQEKRLTRLMKEVEPLLDDALHAKVTQLLCELTAYDIMQMLHTIEETRPRLVFRG